MTVLAGNARRLAPWLSQAERNAIAHALRELRSGGLILPAKRRQEMRLAARAYLELRQSLKEARHG